jgi:hypothetical protein
LVETIERAGNYGVPLTLLILSGFGGKNFKEWFAGISHDILTDERTLVRATTCLRIVAFLLLAGHGGLNLIEKKGLLSQYVSLGFSNPVQVANAAGIFEVIAAFTVLIRPLRPVLLALLVWKIGTELFYPHWEIFEWIERSGSYGTILVLWFMLPNTSLQAQNTSLTNN